MYREKWALIRLKGVQTRRTSSRSVPGLLVETSTLTACRFKKHCENQLINQAYYPCEFYEQLLVFVYLILLGCQWGTSFSQVIGPNCHYDVIDLCVLPSGAVVPLGNKQNQ